MNKAIHHKFMLRLFLAGASAVTFSFAPVLAENAPDAPTHKFSVPGGDLNESLKHFSDQSGVSLVYDHRIVSGRNAPPLTGALTTHDALGMLLNDSSLDYLEIDQSTLAIIKRRVVVELMPELPPSGYDLVKDRARLDEIIVTASYRAPGADTGMRINYSLDAESLELSGAQSVAEPIHDLPANVASVSAANTQLLISAGGLNLADLRGLGPIRSLVLVNGRRFARTNGGNGNIYGVDLNAVPTALIDRVEIINQGAGASLGTDAVAGAVNIVMRDHIEGIAFGAHGGISEHGDAAEYSLSLFAGETFADGRGKLSGGVVYAMDPSLFFTDRDYLSQPYGFALDDRRATAKDGEFTPGFGGSTFTPAGFIAGAVDQSGNTALFGNAADQLRLTPGGYEVFEGRLDQLYNWLNGFSALPEIDRLHGYGRVDYEASSSVSIFGELFFANVDTISQIAPTPVAADTGFSAAYGDSILVPADHPDAPTGLRDAIEASVGGPIESFLINRRFIELGPRNNDIKRQVIDFVLGADFDLGEGWVLDASYKFGQSRTDFASTGYPDASRVAIAVDPVLCAATPGCVPLNIFSAQSVSPEAANYYRLPTRNHRFVTTEHIARFAGSGPLYELNGREGRISAGIEYRRDALNDEGNTSSSSGAALGTFQAPGAKGSVSYGELFFGADLPVSTHDAKFGAIEFGADARITRWNGGGFVANLSGNVSWSPAAGLEFYAYALRGGRAPNIIELHSKGLNTAKVLVDPCSTPSDPRIAANCATSGPLYTPPGFAQRDLLVYRARSGNSKLDNEDVRTRHFGVAADIQEFIYLGDDSLRVTADWRHHRIINSIHSSYDQIAINTCYDSENLENRFCGVNPATGNLFIQRDPATQQLTVIESTYLNGGEAHTSGLDATLAYRTDLLAAPLAPSLAVDVLYSYAHKTKFSGFVANELIDQIGTVNYPRHQFQATASLETDRWKTLWTVRRRGAAQTRQGDIAEAMLPAKVNVDVGIQFRPDENIIVYAGIENLFNSELPIAAYTERGPLAAQYDPIGRRYFAGVKAEF